ncbi:hypothetical protein [Bacillus sp. 2205SS5-2]|uniref:hypothetical protein n=1 Tax=Bacillus sp. 2205SS5-2 TaxID=3109031 RepID=UPI00300535E2
MDSFKNDEYEILIKQLLKQLLNGQMKEINEQQSPTSNSLIILDHQTIQLLLLTQLLNKGNQPLPDSQHATESSKVPDEILDSLDQMIDSNRKKFAELMQIVTSEN